MAVRNYSPIIEFPGVHIGGSQFRVICRRYAFAADQVTSGDVLEVGCGPGLGLGLIGAHARCVVGGDVTAHAIRTARETYAHHTNIYVAGLDAHALPFATATFDFVVGLATIVYLDLGRFLEECRRVLRPSGALVFDIPNRDAPGFRPSPFSTRYLSVPELVATLERHGFHAELYGGFPVSRRGWGEGIASMGDEALIWLGVRRETRERIRRVARRLVRRDSVYLQAELTPAHADAGRAAPLVPIEPRERDAIHAIIYGVARVRQP